MNFRLHLPFSILMIVVFALWTRDFCLTAFVAFGLAGVNLGAISYDKRKKRP